MSRYSPEIHPISKGTLLVVKIKNPTSGTSNYRLKLEGTGAPLVGRGHVFLPLRQIGGYKAQRAWYQIAVINPAPGQKTTYARLKTEAPPFDFELMDYRVGASVSRFGLTYTISAIEPSAPPRFNGPPEDSGKFWTVTLDIKGKSDRAIPIGFYPYDRPGLKLDLIDENNKLASRRLFDAEAGKALKNVGPNEKVVLPYRRAIVSPVPSPDATKLCFAVNFTPDQSAKIQLSTAYTKFVDLVGARIAP